MNKGRFGLALAMLASMALLFPAPQFAAGQAPRASGTAWNPPRTPDGQPDIQGTWGTGPDEVLYTGDIETGEGDETARRMQGRVDTKGKSLVIDPPGGLIPYRTLHVGGPGHAQLPGHHHRPERVHEAVDGGISHQPQTR